MGGRTAVGPVKNKGLSQRTRATFLFVDGTQKLKLSKTRAKPVRGLLRYLCKNSDNTGTVFKGKTPETAGRRVGAHAEIPEC